MAGDRTLPPSDPDGPAAGAGQGWTALGYLLSGILVWGGIGWLVDQWLGTGGIAIAVGSVVGAGAGVYLIARRLGV